MTTKADFINQVIVARKAKEECPEGKDAYTYAAAKFFKTSYEQVTPTQRAYVKGLIWL